MRPTCVQTDADRAKHGRCRARRVALHLGSLGAPGSGGASIMKAQTRFPPLRLLRLSAFAFPSAFSLCLRALASLRFSDGVPDHACIGLL